MGYVSQTILTMEINILKQTDTLIECSIKGINHVLANTLRRLLISEIPVMAIEEVDFQKNNSALYDEILAHRLGLVPLTTDLKSYNLQEECKCEGKGCAMCQLLLTLDATGPVTVYAKDLESKDPKVKPVFDKIPIVVLNKNQKLKLEATAILGQGKAHMKFSPGWVYYQYFPVVKIQNVQNAEELASIYPTLFEVSGGKLQLKEDADMDKLMNVETSLAKPAKSLEITQDTSRFFFHIESFGQLSVKEMFTTALDVFDKKLVEFEKILKKTK